MIKKDKTVLKKFSGEIAKMKLAMKMMKPVPVPPVV